MAVFGLRKYLSLALKGNPTILLALFVPPEFVRDVNLFGYTLQTLYPKIVSQQVFNPFRGYMRQQHERLMGSRGQKRCTRPELVEKFGYDTKYAAHVVRLGLQGVELLGTGRLSLPMNLTGRDLVRGVRQGMYTLDEVSELIKHCEAMLASAKELTTLPERPQYDAIEQWMLSVYRFHWGQEK